MLATLPLSVYTLRLRSNATVRTAGFSVPLTPSRRCDPSMKMHEGPESDALGGHRFGAFIYDPGTSPYPTPGWVSVHSGHLDHGNFSVNQVESAFMPFRSMFEPSHTAKAMGTDIPALNWVSFASLVSSERFTTTRQVGPV